MSYVAYPIASEPEDLIADVIAFIQSRFPGWEPYDGNLDTALIEAFAATAADVRELASQVPDTVFRYFGANIVGLQPDDATQATADSTWTARDTNGYTVLAGTRVGIRNSSGDIIPFQVVFDVNIPAGSAVTAAGQVALLAVEPGSSGGGLGSPGGPVELIDILDWVLSVTQVAVTSGGIDAELDSDYLNRLKGYLTLLAPRPILPQDFAILARQIPGVYRAVAIDLYDPASGTFDNPRMVTVVAVDTNGTGVSSQIRQDILDYLVARREQNFIVNIADPSYAIIDVTYQVKSLPGYDLADLEARIDAALGTYLNAATWGVPPGDDLQAWKDSPVVRYLEVAQVINSVDGVDYITTSSALYDLLIGVHGTTLGRSDIVLSSVAALVNIGTITGAVL